MGDFTVIVKRDGKEEFRFEVWQKEFDIAEKMGISKQAYIDQMVKLKIKECNGEDISDRR